MRLPDDSRREWVKPIMFTAGLGSMDATHTEKRAAEPGMVIVKVGGPAYRIGMGGGAASSVDVQVCDFVCIWGSLQHLPATFRRVTPHEMPALTSMQSSVAMPRWSRR